MKQAEVSRETLPTEPAYRYRATCERVIDGDTYVLRVDLGFRVAVSFECRLHGIDVYEHGTPRGKMATQYARDLLTIPTKDGTVMPLIIESYRDQRTFARWVCDVWVHGSSLADIMRDNGFEKPKP